MMRRAATWGLAIIGVWLLVSVILMGLRLLS